MGCTIRVSEENRVVPLDDTSLMRGSKPSDDRYNASGKERGGP